MFKSEKNPLKASLSWDAHSLQSDKGDKWVWRPQGILEAKSGGLQHPHLLSINLVHCLSSTHCTSRAFHSCILLCKLFQTLCLSLYKGLFLSCSTIFRCLLFTNCQSASLSLHAGLTALSALACLFPSGLIQQTCITLQDTKGLQ